MGPWKAARDFVARLGPKLEQTDRIEIHLYGSLAKTGKGHGTDLATMLGLLNEDPETIPPEQVFPKFEAIRKNKLLDVAGSHSIAFDEKTDLVWHMDECLVGHPNGVRFVALDNGSLLLAESYFSVGGGFIRREGDTSSGHADTPLPHPIATAAELLEHCEQVGSIADVVMMNERVWRSDAEIEAGLDRIAREMVLCAHRGCHTTGTLPGGLNVVRRAAGVCSDLLPPVGTSASPLEGLSGYDVAGSAPRPAGDPVELWLESIRSSHPDFSRILKWVSAFALAVNEENAAFGRVVTAPTNGAAGVVPAVLLYLRCFTGHRTDRDIREFLLVAAEIGSLFKKGATISAAMGGCQAEIGVSSAMAAAGLAHCLGANAERALVAAEIAMEHHLGLTCDPIGGLVQIPCIERNTMGAIKAITAATIALETQPGSAKVSLDDVIRTMWHTARDMSTKYKETSEGGLAVHIPVTVPEC